MLMPDTDVKEFLEQLEDKISSTVEKSFAKLQPLEHHIDSCPKCQGALKNIKAELKVEQPIHHSVAEVLKCSTCAPQLEQYVQRRMSGLVPEERYIPVPKEDKFPPPRVVEAPLFG